MGVLARGLIPIGGNYTMSVGQISMAAAKANAMLSGSVMQQVVNIAKLADDSVLPIMAKSLDDVGGMLKTLSSSGAQRVIGPRVNLAHHAAQSVQSLGVTVRGGVMPTAPMLNDTLAAVNRLARSVASLT